MGDEEYLANREQRERDFEELQFQAEWLLSDWERPNGAGLGEANLVEFLELLVDYDSALPEKVRLALQDAFERHNRGDEGEDGYNSSKRVPLDRALRAEVVKIRRAPRRDKERAAVEDLLNEYEGSGTMPPVLAVATEKGLFRKLRDDLIAMKFKGVTLNTAEKIYNDSKFKKAKSKNAKSASRLRKPDLGDFSEF